MISFRITETEFERLRDLSESKGARSISDYARLSLCGGDGVMVPDRIEAKIQQLDGKVQSLASRMNTLASLIERTHEAIKNSNGAKNSTDNRK